VFSTTFSLPPPVGKDVEGSSELNPFELTGISKKDFQAFLKVLYPLYVISSIAYPLEDSLKQFIRTIPHSYKDITLEEWKSILLLSSMWEFQHIRQLAIQILDRSGSAVFKPAEKIYLGRKFDIRQWLVSGLTEMVQDSNGPRAEDVILLGVDVAVRIWDLREECIRAQMRGYTFSWQDKVVRAFEDVLKGVSSPPCSDSSCSSSSQTSRTALVFQ